MLTSVHNNTDNADAADDTDTTDDYNRVIGIALPKAFSCANKVSINSFRAYLKQNLEKFKHCNDLRNLYEGDMSAVKSTMDIHAPLKETKLTRKSKYSWFDQDAHRIRHQRRIAKTHWIRTKKDSDRKHYSHINTWYKRHIFKCKRKNLNGLINGRKKTITHNKLTRESRKYICRLFHEKIDTIAAKFDDNSIYTPPKS